MSETLRPHLKLEEIRSITDRIYPAGGGGGTYPREDYRRHAGKIFRHTQKLKESFENTEDQNLTRKRYIRVELPKESNVHAGEGETLSKNILGELVGAPKKNVGHFSTNENSLDLLSEQLKTYRDTDKHTGKSKFAPIEKISNIPSSEKISDNLKAILKEGIEPGEVLVSLFPDLSRDEVATIKKAMIDFLKDGNGEIVSGYEGISGQLFKVKAKANKIAPLADCFLAIQTVDPVGDLFVESAIIGEPIEETVRVIPNQSTAKVCIFDSGVVSGSRFFETSIIDNEEPIGPPHSVEHGTFVASRIIYGNSLRDSISEGQLTPDVKVLSVCMKSHDAVGNPKAATGDDFVRIIRNTVERWHSQISVYNLSMNLILNNKGYVVTDDHVGPVAAELDSLSRKFGVLFILTTGNYPINEPVPNKRYPDYFKSESCRLCQPSEAMLALTVGSSADRENRGSIAKKNTPSPFTRRGPGFSAYRKPDLVAPGGNLTKDWKQFDDLSSAGIDQGGGNIAYSTGTSFAAPIISRLAAKIFENIQDATPDLVRAMLIHSATVSGWEHLDENLLLQLVGNGEPDTAFLLSSDRWNQHFMYQGQIDYRKIVKIPFYVPSALTDREGRKKVRVQFTLAFSPETNRTLKSGYCKSHLRTKIYKKNDEGDLYGVTATRNHISVTDKYSTVLRYDRVFSSGLQSGDWELEIEQQSRWTLKDTNTPFAFVLTISDPQEDQSIDIYQAIQTEAANRFQDLIPIKPRVKV